MDTWKMPGCCTAMVLHGFGEEDGGTPIDYRACMAYMEVEADRYRKLGYAMLIATSTKGQLEFNKALIDSGYKRTKWMKKKKYYSTVVAMWHLHLYPGKPE
jgi:hypothetical protein